MRGVRARYLSVSAPALFLLFSFVALFLSALFCFLFFSTDPDGRRRTIVSLVAIASARARVHAATTHYTRTDDECSLEIFFFVTRDMVLRLSLRFVISARGDGAVAVGILAVAILAYKISRRRRAELKTQSTRRLLSRKLARHRGAVSNKRY